MRALIWIEHNHKHKQKFMSEFKLVTSGFRFRHTVFVSEHTALRLGEQKGTKLNN